jgi:hypothetical protein
MACYCSSLTLCSCDAGWRLSHHHHEVSATVYDLIGKKSVTVRTKKCQSCRTIIGPNFKNTGGALTNNVKVSTLGRADVLFINVKIGFTIRYL